MRDFLLIVKGLRLSISVAITWILHKNAFACAYERIQHIVINARQSDGQHLFTMKISCNSHGLFQDIRFANQHCLRMCSNRHCVRRLEIFTYASMVRNLHWLLKIGKFQIEIVWVMRVAKEKIIFACAKSTNRITLNFIEGHMWYNPFSLQKKWKWLIKISPILCEINMKNLLCWILNYLIY